MSRAGGWQWYLDVYEQILAANTPRSSQEKPQPFRPLKLRKSCIHLSHILPCEMHTLEGWRTQTATTSGPKHADLALGWRLFLFALNAKAGMSTLFLWKWCSVRLQTPQSTRAEWSPFSNLELHFQPRTALYKISHWLKVFLIRLGYVATSRYRSDQHSHWVDISAPNSFL